MTEVARYTFHVASNQRNSGTNTDMNLQLSQVITPLAAKSQFHVMVHGMTIPFSFYQLSADIASLTVTVSGSGAGVINLTPGNYTTVSIINEINSKLTALCNTFVPIVVPIFTSSYSTITGRTTFSVTSPAGKVFVLYFSLNQTLGSFFGFSDNAIFSSTGSATGDKVAVANPATQLFLRSPSFNQSNNKEWIVEKDVFCDIIYRVPIGTNVGTYIQWVGDSERIVLKNDSFSIINLYLTTNLTYVPIDLQGLPFSVHFTIIELLQTPYVPITSFISTNLIASTPIESTEELERLQKDRMDALKRLETYKKKLTPKQ